MNKNYFVNKTLEIVKEKDVFYLVESGSRLWGFESKDSDYDIRGFFIHNKKEEFSIKKKDYFEYLDKNNYFDLVLFHIDKAFNLLTKSNPSVIEWLIATENDVYMDLFNLRSWFNKEVKDLINPKALFFHYYNLAKNNWQKYFLTQNKPTYKKILYVLRGLFSSQYILTYGEIPPIKFLDLSKRVVDKEIYKEIEEIVRIKKEGDESLVFDKKEILELIKELFDDLKNKGEEIIYKKENERILFEKVNKKAVEIKEKLLC
jgi:predicted nucleotidyltransferase